MAKWVAVAARLAFPSLLVYQAIGRKDTMPAQRFHAAQDGHIVMALPPQNITGGVHSLAINFTKYTHLSALVGFGATSAQVGLVTVEVCTAQNGTGSTAIPFTLFAQETNGGDVLGAQVNVPSTGYQPPNTANINYCIEVDSAQIPNNAVTGASAGYNYIRVSIADAANTDLAAIFFVLSGARYAADQSPTVLV